MRPLLPLLLVMLLAGCGTEAASPATPTAGVVPATATPGVVRPTAAPRPKTFVPTPTPKPVVGKPYAFFLGRVCHALATGNADTIISLLPYYQYNNGLRYAVLGSGEGQTADPNIMRTWLASARPHCVSYTPGIMGHGAVLTTGWNKPAASSLVELDMYNHIWKINDFTFGNRVYLQQAIHSSGPVVRYHG